MMSTFMNLNFSCLSRRYTMLKGKFDGVHAMISLAKIDSVTVDGLLNFEKTFLEYSTTCKKDDTDLCIVEIDIADTSTIALYDAVYTQHHTTER